MGGLAFFAVIFGIGAENMGGKRKLKIRAGAGFRCFRSGDVRFASGTERNKGFQFFSRPHKLTSATRARRTKNEG